MVIDVITSLQGVFTYFIVVWNFRVDAKLFRSAPVRIIIGSVRGRGHRIYYFSVRSGSGQKITERFGVGVPLNLAPQDSSVDFN